MCSNGYRKFFRKVAVSGCLVEVELRNLGLAERTVPVVLVTFLTPAASARNSSHICSFDSDTIRKSRVVHAVVVVEVVRRSVGFALGTSHVVALAFLARASEASHSCSIS